MSRRSPFGPGIRLAIFDADNTLRRTLVPGQPCPRAPDEWELLPGVRDVLGAVDWERCGVRVGVASNQDQVGYGHLSAATAGRLLRDMVLAATDGRVSDPVIRFCPHVLEVSCACRKPEPGMLLSIMEECAVTAERTLFVGDSPVDAEAARRAGARFVHASGFFDARRAAGPLRA